MTGATTWPTWVSSSWIASLVSAMTSPLNLICTRTPAGFVVMRCFGYFFQPGPLLALMELSCFQLVSQIPSSPIPIVHFLPNPKNGPPRKTSPQCGKARLLRCPRRLRQHLARRAARLDGDRRRAPTRERRSGRSRAVLRRPRRRGAARRLEPLRRFALCFAHRASPRRYQPARGARGARGRLGFGVLPAHPYRSDAPFGRRVALARPGAARPRRPPRLFARRLAGAPGHLLPWRRETARHRRAQHPEALQGPHRRDAAVRDAHVRLVERRPRRHDRPQRLHREDPDDRRRKGRQPHRRVARVPRN